MRELVKAAKAHGARSVKIIPARDACVDRRTRLKCLVPRYSSLGRHLLCPPNETTCGPRLITPLI